MAITGILILAWTNVTTGADITRKVRLTTSAVLSIF